MYIIKPIYELINARLKQSSMNRESYDRIKMYLITTESTSLLRILD